MTQQREQGWLNSVSNRGQSKIKVREVGENMICSGNQKKTNTT